MNEHYYTVNQLIDELTEIVEENPELGPVPVCFDNKTDLVEEVIPDEKLGEWVMIR